MFKIFSMYYLFIIGIQLLGRSGQRPEFSQATGMALVRCILGKFLGVVCHCFPLQYVYLLNKYLKCSVWRLALRYDIYIYVVRL